MDRIRRSSDCRLRDIFLHLPADDQINMAVFDKNIPTSETLKRKFVEKLTAKKNSRTEGSRRKIMRAVVMQLWCNTAAILVTNIIRVFNKENGSIR